jgi:acyl carrier protein
MQRDGYLIWLKKWFHNKTGYQIDTNNSDFFVSGILDSFKTLELIADIEKYLEIILSDENLNDERFSTLNGLSSILFEVKNMQGEGLDD